jgi:hypothetical protein
MCECTVTALLFSGRKDPSWTIGRAEMSRVEEAWPSLQEAHENASYPRLGYRGCRVRCPDDREWMLHRGIVTLKQKTGRESRMDSQRALERFVLATAPPGLLPPLNALLGDDPG